MDEVIEQARKSLIDEINSYFDNEKINARELPQDYDGCTAEDFRVFFIEHIAS